MTLSKMLEKSSEKYSEKEAIIFKNTKLTYKQLNSKVNRLTNVLKKLEVKKGDRVVILLPNIPEFVISYFAITQLGAIVLPLNPSFRASEIKYFFDNSQPCLVITIPDLVSLVQEVKKEIPSIKNILVTGRRNIQGAISLENIMNKSSPSFKLREEVSPDDPAVLIYTSGVTTIPRGALLTHSNLLSNIKSIIKLGEIRRTDCILCVLPLFHSYAMTVCMNVPLFKGAKIVIWEKFIPQEVIAAIWKFKVSIFFGVPTMFAYILNQPGLSQKKFSSLRICLSGGSALSPEVAYSFKEKIGREILEGYGLTEASPVVCFNPLRGQKKIGSIGIPIPGVEVKIVNDEGNEVSYGEVGEIIIKGKNIMKGYYNNPQATDEIIKDGWLYTGDLGKKDQDGYYYIVGRKKDVIIVGGFNVYPQEVENTLLSHPEILEAAVVGVSDKFKGEAIKAYVVLKQESKLSYEEIIEYCKERLAPYKIPRYLEFRDSLPKTDTGKILKKEL